MGDGTASIVENVPLRYTLGCTTPAGTAPKATEEESAPDGIICEGEEERGMLQGDDPNSAGDGEAITPIHERANAHPSADSAEHKSVTTVVISNLYIISFNKL